jgi:hypothetical protein
MSLARRRGLPGSDDTMNPVFEVGSQRINAVYAAREARTEMNVKDFRGIYVNIHRPPFTTHLPRVGARSVPKNPGQENVLQLLAGQLAFTIQAQAFRRMANTFDGNPSKVALPVHTNLNVLKSTITPKTGPGSREIDDVNAIGAERAIRFAGVVTKPDSRGDTGEGNTTLHVAGPRTIANTSPKYIYEGQYVKFRVPRAYELAMGKGEEMSRQGIFPVLWPEGVDFEVHDLMNYTFTSRLFLPDGAINRGVAALAKYGRGGVDAQKADVFWNAGTISKLSDEKGLPIFVTDEERAWAAILASYAVMSIPVNSATRGIDTTGAWIAAANNVAAAFQIGGNDGVYMFTNGVTRTLMAQRAVVGTHDATIFGRALTTAAPGGELDIIVLQPGR